MTLNELLPIEIEEFFKPLLSEREFRNLWSGIPRAADTKGFNPRINVTEDAQMLTLTAELPGMTEKDFDVQLNKDNLVLSGEKKVEHEKTEAGRHYFERSYGSFRRVVPLNFDVDEGKIEATFKNGVLHLRVPKTIEAQRGTRKISIKTA